MGQEWTIGRVATLAGVTVETVRYYQRRGLVTTPPKPQRGQRRYNATIVQRIRFIRRAQALGFTLEEAANLLRLEVPGACAATRALAAHKVALIESKLHDLTVLHGVLSSLISQCAAGELVQGCPVIQAISGEGSPDRDLSTESK